MHALKYLKPLLPSNGLWVARAQEPQLALSALPADSELPALVKSITEVTGTQEEHVLRVGRFLFARLFEGVHGR